jgi:hypothetical protein
MRTTVTGLAVAVVLALVGSAAHADGYFGPGPAPWACNSPYYGAGPNGGWYCPNLCFQGPCLPPAPFNGMLAIPNHNGNGAGNGAPYPGLATFPTHPFARSPRDFFMYGQENNNGCW